MEDSATVRRRSAATAALAAVLLVPGCGEGGSPGPEDLQLDLVVGAEVAVVDVDYRPAEVTVEAGELVEFTNEGQLEHTITADDDRFDSGRQRPGETFTYLTDPDGREVEVIEYHCEIHPRRMRGSITVRPAPAVG